MESESKEKTKRKKHPKLKLPLKNKKKKESSKYFSESISLQLDSSDTEESSSTVANPSIFKSTNFDPPPKESIVYQTPCTVYIEMKGLNGDLIITKESIIYISKQVKPTFKIEVFYDDVIKVTKVNKKGMDKGISITTNSGSVNYYGLKERFKILYFIEICKYKGSTFGFNVNDDAEVLQKITPLRSQQIIEKEISKPSCEILEELKAPNLLRQMYEECGCKNIRVSTWSKTKSGISRDVEYQVKILQDIDVTSTQRLMKSGETIALDIYSKYSMTSNSDFLNTHFQLLFKDNDDKITIRSAINFNWAQDPWNKELVFASILKMVKISFYFLECHFSEKEFSKNDYEGKWKKHKPYIITLVVLVVMLAMAIILPSDTNWIKVIFGLFILFLLYIS